jgi:hypothetical protein
MREGEFNKTNSQLKDQFYCTFCKPEILHGCQTVKLNTVSTAAAAATNSSTYRNDCQQSGQENGSVGQ